MQDTRSVPHGVGLFVVYGNEILTLEELRAKPVFGKLAGMLTIPFETSHAGERDTDALWRLVEEEIGIPGIITDITKLPNKLYLPHATIALAITKVSRKFDAQPKDSDVAFHGWLTVEAFRALSKEKRRIEVLPAIEQYEKHTVPL